MDNTNAVMRSKRNNGDKGTAVTRVTGVTRVTSVTRVTGKGFAGTKPTCNLHGEYNIPVNAKKSITEHFMEFVKDSGPYSHFITLTFSRIMNTQNSYCYCNELLDNLNEKLHPRRNSNRYLEGFAFVEDHKSGDSRSDIHFHILLKHDARYDKYSFAQLKQIFHKAAHSVVDARNRRIFNEDCIDFQEVRDDGVISYCFKQVWDKNLSRVKLIGKDGLSDKE